VTAAAAKAAAKGGASKGGAKTAASKVFKGGASKRATITAVSAAAPPPQAREPAPEAAPSKAGRAVVAYNHYKSEFKIDDDGAMAWADIDEEYCISFVFKGEIQVALVTEQGEAIQVAGGKFAGLARSPSERRNANFAFRRSLGDHHALEIITESEHLCLC